MQVKPSLSATIISLFAVVGLAVAGYLVLDGTGLFPRNSFDSRLHLPAADAARGRAMIRKHGCTACHIVAGVPDALGRVGPRLDRVSERIYIGGVLPNTPQNLVSWIRNPREASPRTAMPDLNVAEQDARDIAAYLYSLP